MTAPKFLATIAGAIVAAAVATIIYLVGWLSPLVVFSSNPFQDFMIFWVVAIFATVFSDCFMKSHIGDYMLDLALISPLASFGFVWLMRQVCGEYWFNTTILATNRWIAIVVYIFSCSMIAVVTKSWVMTKTK